MTPARRAFVPGAPGVTAARAEDGSGRADGSGSEDGCVVIEVGSGSYDFTLTAAGLGKEAPGR